MKKGKNPPVNSLYYGQTKWAPQDRDWSEGYTEEWDYVAASRCDECGQVVFGVQEGDSITHAEANTDEPSECEGHVSGASPPMMNSLYPLEHYSGTVEDAAAAIVDLPLCVVTDGHGDILGLALTGGGMDLSWEIAEAFMRLGYLPPIIRLPAMSGRGESARDKWIIAGMKRSIAGERATLKRDLADLKETASHGRRQRQRQKQEQLYAVTSPHGMCETYCVEHEANPEIEPCR